MKCGGFCLKEAIPSILGWRHHLLHRADRTSINGARPIYCGRPTGRSVCISTKRTTVVTCIRGEFEEGMFTRCTATGPYLDLLRVLIAWAGEVSYVLLSQRESKINTRYGRLEHHYQDLQPGQDSSRWSLEEAIFPPEMPLPPHPIQYHATNVFSPTA